MTSFIYFYSKFTEEFLLLSAAGIFTLLSLYCYHWVVKRRLLGAARNQVPAGVVKAYLNQLINETQFVRTQLFGLIAAGEKTPNFANFQMGSSHGAAPVSHESHHSSSAAPASVPSDLLERLKALEAQLSEKESMVVNVNIEKSKLSEEIDNLRTNQKVAMNQSSSAGSEDLVNKIKMLEERLEEYSLFEDDLANLKRLQQENTQLKKRLEDGLNSPPRNVEPAISNDPPTYEKGPEPVVAAAEPVRDIPVPEKASLLDQNAINSLLDGVSATPVSPQKNEPSIEPAMDAAPAEAVSAAAPEAISSAEIEALLAAEQAAPSTPAVEPPKLKLAPEPAVEVPPPAAAPAARDEFEKLVDSVETSLDLAPAPAAKAVEATPEENLAAKSDEELLKEFENLLNS